jgi:hypothetical protein
MTKEEIFKTFADPWLCDGLIGASYDGPNENIYAAMDQYAKQQAVEFAEWVSEKYHMTLRANGGKSVWHPRYMALDKKNDIPVEELYAQFIESQTIQ